MCSTLSMVPANAMGEMRETAIHVSQNKGPQDQEPNLRRPEYDAEVLNIKP
jgi:hypothetical protein